MIDSYGNVLAFEYAKLFQAIEKKKSKIRDHFKANKDTAKETFDRIMIILEEATKRFDFSLAINQVEFEIREEVVYKSDSAGVKDWSFPAQELMSWHNPLSAIVRQNSHEFNFVFKNGLTSDAPI